MKRFLVVLLILGISMGAFAQLKATVTADFNPELLRITSYTGDYADKAKGSYLGAGTTSVLASQGNGDMGKENELRLSLNYTGEGYSAYMRLNGDTFVRNYGGASPEGKLVSGQANNLTPNDLLGRSFDEWYLRGTVGIFNLYIGTTADRGKVKTFQNFHDYLKTKVDNYGVLALTSAAGGLSDLDNNNFLRAMSVASNMSRTNQPYFSISTKFDPITVQVAGDVGMTGHGAVTGSPTNANSWTHFNGALRVSGEKIANMVTFDALYKIRGGDPDTDDNVGTQPDGTGYSVHTIGLYANLDVVENLGIGLGYTALFRSYEDAKVGSNTVKTTGPLFSGIDLRFQYTGIENLTLTFNNNISFAGNSGKTSGDEATRGVLYQTINDGSDSYLALYNALGANYKLSNELTVRGMVGNRFRTRTFENKTGGVTTETKGTANTLGIAALASYSFNSHVLLESGLEFLLDSLSSEVTTGGTSTSSDGGTLRFAIPIRMKIVY